MLRVGCLPRHSESSESDPQRKKKCVKNKERKKKNINRKKKKAFEQM